MSDPYTELLSAYLDHDLPRSQADAVQRHLEVCADCRDVLASLTNVKTRATTLVDPPAPTDLWAGIASRIGTAGSSSAVPARRAVVYELPQRRHAWAGSQWLAAAATFAIVASGALWLAHDRMSPPLRPAADSVPAGAKASGTDVSPADFDATRIEGEIGLLQ